MKIRYMLLALLSQAVLLTFGVYFFVGEEHAWSWGAVFFSVALGGTLLYAFFVAKRWLDQKWPPGMTLYIGPRE